MNAWQPAKARTNEATENNLGAVGTSPSRFKKCFARAPGFETLRLQELR